MTTSPARGLQLARQQWGPAPTADTPCVILVHGITANALSFDVVGPALAGLGWSVMAPDLRGRAGSARVPAGDGATGILGHADDVLELARTLPQPPVLVGHSMGGLVVARAAAQDPGAVAGVVLVDGGLAFPAPPGLDVQAALDATIGPAMQRLSMVFPGPEACLDFWRQHPAVGPALAGTRSSEVSAYLLADLVPAPNGNGDAVSDRDRAGDRAGTGVVSSCVAQVVREDGADVLADEATHEAARRAAQAGVPIRFIWADRGLMDEPQGLYDESRLAALELPAQLEPVHVPTANHYSVLFDDPGVDAILDAVESLRP